MPRTGAPGGAGGGGKRVVISSLTGKRIPWGDETEPDEDGKKKGTSSKDSADDDRIRRDVPPHWGRGQ